MRMTTVAIVGLVACGSGKREDPTAGSSPSPAPTAHPDASPGAAARGSNQAAGSAGSGSPAAPATIANTFYGAAVPAAPPAPPAVDPPTLESLHVDVSRAVLAWMKDPRARDHYGKDFAGRHEPDGRVALVPYEAFVKGLPAGPIDFANPSIKTWLDKGDSAIDDGDVRVNLSYDHAAGDEYREQTWHRSDGRLVLIKEQVNSRNSHQADRKALRNFFDVDATKLGTDVTARVRIEGPIALFVVENAKHDQAVVDLWPPGPCTTTAPPADRKDVAVLLRCGDQDFAIVSRPGALSIQRSPAGQTSPMSTDRTVKLAARAKVAFAP